MFRTIEVNDIKAIMFYDHLDTDELNILNKEFDDIIHCNTCMSLNDNKYYNTMIDELQCRECFIDYTHSSISHSDEDFKRMNYNFKTMLHKLQLAKKNII